MSAVTLDQIKAHMGITTADDDDLLTSKIEAAERFVQDYVGLGLQPLTAQAAPTIKEAIRRLVAQMYEHRELDLVGSSFGEMSPTITELLGPFRESWFGE